MSKKHAKDTEKIRQSTSIPIKSADRIRRLALLRSWTTAERPPTKTYHHLAALPYKPSRFTGSNAPVMATPLPPIAANPLKPQGQSLRRSGLPSNFRNNPTAGNKRILELAGPKRRGNANPDENNCRNEHIDNNASPPNKRHESANGIGGDTGNAGHEQIIDVHSKVSAIDALHPTEAVLANDESVVPELGGDMRGQGADNNPRNANEADGKYGDARLMTALATGRNFAFWNRPMAVRNRVKNCKLP